MSNPCIGNRHWRRGSLLPSGFLFAASDTEALRMNPSASAPGGGSVRYPHLHYARRATIEFLLLDIRPGYGRWETPVDAAVGAASSD